MADAGVRKSKKSSGESMNVQNWPPLEGLGRHPALAALAEGQADAEAIEAFLAGQEFPLTEPGTLTFAWHGQAEHVHLVRWIHGGADRQPFVQLAGTDLWLLRSRSRTAGGSSTSSPSGSTGTSSSSVDPRNPARAGDPFGENSVARTRGYERPEWSLPRGAPAGRIETMSVASRAFGEARDVGVYLPAGHDPERTYPLVVVHDGGDFVTYADLPVVARQPDRRRRDPPGDRGAGADERPAGRIFRRPASIPHSSSGTSCRRSRRACGSPRRRPSGCCSARASGRWPRSSPPSAIPASSAGWC